MVYLNAHWTDTNIQCTRGQPTNALFWCWFHLFCIVVSGGAILQVFFPPFFSRDIAYLFDNNLLFKNFWCFGLMVKIFSGYNVIWEMQPFFLCDRIVSPTENLCEQYNAFFIIINCILQSSTTTTTKQINAKLRQKNSKTKNWVKRLYRVRQNERAERDGTIKTDIFFWFETVKKSSEKST